MEIVRQVLDMPEFAARTAQVKFVANEQNLGIAASRNVALDHATGEYVLFVDSDDWLDLCAVENLAAKAVADSADMVIYDFWMVHEGWFRREKNPVFSGKKKYIRAMLLRRLTPSMWSKLVRRRLFDEVRFVPGMNYGEDYYISPILAYGADKIVSLPEPLYYYLSHDASVSYNVTRAKARMLMDIVERLGAFFGTKPDYAPIVWQMKIRNRIMLLRLAVRRRMPKPSKLIRL